MGDYSFDALLRPGDRLAFGNMAISTTVKNTTFTGMNLPSIAVLGTDGRVRLLREFGYGDFKERL
jgi:carboxynorspermidine decarboxylase